ncbi:MAG: DUF6282 family protein [Rhodospirillaceae bacterium]
MNEVLGVDRDGRTDAGDERKAMIERLLVGAIDLHCHSGPSVMPRDFDHIEAIKEASDAGLRAVLFKDHYYSADPIAELLRRNYGHLGVDLLSGVALNNSVGGINRYAVDHSIKLGGRIVWMPTFSSANHLEQHKRDKHFDKKFPTTKEKMLQPTPLRALDDNGEVHDELKFILDLIAEADMVLSAGHLHISEIWPLFEEAKKRGVRRLLVNHPTYVVGAEIEQVRQIVDMGAYVEHSICMFVEGSKFKFYEPETLDALIKAGTLDRTILGSDLGQLNNPRPVNGFRAVIGICLDLGYSEEDIRKMVSTNAARLFGLHLDEPAPIT